MNGVLNDNRSPVPFSPSGHQVALCTHHHRLFLPLLEDIRSTSGGNAALGRAAPPDCGFGTRRSYVLLFLCCYLTVQIHVPEPAFTSGHLPASHERRPKRQQVACSFFSFRTSSRPLYPPSSAVPPCPRRHQVDCPRPVTSVLNDNRSPALSSP